MREVLDEWLKSDLVKCPKDELKNCYATGQRYKLEGNYVKAKSLWVDHWNRKTSDSWLSGLSLATYLRDQCCRPEMALLMASDVNSAYPEIERIQALLLALFCDLEMFIDANQIFLYFAKCIDNVSDGYSLQSLTRYVKAINQSNHSRKNLRQLHQKLNSRSLNNDNWLDILELLHALGEKDLSSRLELSLDRANSETDWIRLLSLAVQYEDQSFFERAQVLVPEQYLEKCTDYLMDNGYLSINSLLVTRTQKAIEKSDASSIDGLRLGCALMRLGCKDLYALGLYERRKNSAEYTKVYTSLPAWRPGMQRRGLLIYREQGIGDELFFLSYLSEFSQLLLQTSQDTVIILEVSNRIKEIMKNFVREIPLCSEHLVFSKGDEYDGSQEIDTALPLGSMAMWAIAHKGIKQQPAQMLSKHEYTKSPLDISCVDSRYEQAKALRVGVAWRSTNQTSRAHLKSIPLSLIYSLFNADLRVTSLQHDLWPEERILLQANNIEIPDFDVTNNFEALGDEISACDVVITVSTALAHFCALSGYRCQVWVLVPRCQASIWYWGSKELGYSPWYRNAKCYYQDQIGSWHSALQAVAADLKYLIADRRAIAKDS